MEVDAGLIELSDFKFNEEDLVFFQKNFDRIFTPIIRIYIYVCNNWYNKNLQCAFHYRIAICLTEENIDSNNTRLTSSNNHVNDANSYAAGRVKNEIYDIRRPDNLFMRPEETVTADYSYLKTRVTMKIVTSISRL